MRVLHLPGRWLLAALAAVLLIAAVGATATRAADPDDAALVQRVKDAAATTQAGMTERFADGLYDAASGDVYIDGDPTIYRLAGDALVPAPQSGLASRREPCGGGIYFHCEDTLAKAGCQPTTFYLNYQNDNFSDPYGRLLVPPEQVNIRNDEGKGYRRYGPRGVRAEHSGRYGFYSVNCVSG